jgi:hypothetical protein
MIRTAVFAAMLSATALAGPAGAQQYWLPNGPGGTTWNNPQGSLLGTMNEHILQRHAWQHRYGNQGGQQPVRPAALGDVTLFTPLEGVGHGQGLLRLQP